MVERPDHTVVATFFSHEAFFAGASTTLGEDAAQHAKVLRLGPGVTVGLRDGNGNAAVGTLARLTKKSLTVDVAETREIPSRPVVHMLVPVADRDRMLLLAEKATELGATSWRPVMWRRSRSVGPAGDGPAFNSRVRGRMTSALIQCGGGWLPEIHPSAPLARAIAAAPEGSRFLLDANSETFLIASQLTEPVVLAIGPEGGVDSREREEIIAAGFIPVALAGEILRFETAGIAALAIVRSMLGSGESHTKGGKN
ncbi:MAG: RsmE family RNA methyltransferase [Thermoanaerobaculia bacterium]